MRPIKRNVGCYGQLAFIQVGGDLGNEKGGRRVESCVFSGGAEQADIPLHPIEDKGYYLTGLEW